MLNVLPINKEKLKLCKSKKKKKDLFITNFV